MTTPNAIFSAGALIAFALLLGLIAIHRSLSAVADAFYGVDRAVTHIAHQWDDPKDGEQIAAAIDRLADPIDTLVAELQEELVHARKEQEERGIRR